MDNQTKALLLGVSLRWRRVQLGSVRDYEREKRLNRGLDRLTINHETLEPDTLSKMFDNPEAVIEWLADNPKVLATIGLGHVVLRSSEFSDIDFEAYTCPFESGWAVESFAKSEVKEFSHWVAEWAFC